MTYTSTNALSGITVGGDSADINADTPKNMIIREARRALERAQSARAKEFALRTQAEDQKAIADRCDTIAQAYDEILEKMGWQISKKPRTIADKPSNMKIVSSDLDISIPDGLQDTEAAGEGEGA